MIGMLRGHVESVDAVSAIIEVGGVGYEVRMPSADLASMHAGQEIKVYTSLNVSQDAITLFGFGTLASKRMFLQLQKVSGIGPKVALSLLSTLPPDRLARLWRMVMPLRWPSSGLGKKGAQKIILELKGSIDLSQIEGSSATASTPEDTGAEQVVEGLMSLGWHQQDAVHAVQTVCADNQIETPLNAEDVPRVLKLALTSLDRGR